MAAIRSRIVLRRGSGRGRARWSLTVALVTGALLIGGTLGAAARGWIEPLLGLRARSARQAAPAASSSRAPNGRKGRVAGLAAAARPSAEPEPPIEPAPSLSPESVPTPAPEDLPERTRRRTARLAGPGLARPLDGASDEARLLGTAIRRLRRDHDARGALAALDQGAVKFSGGQLDAEAALVRVEALLALDDRTGARSRCSTDATWRRDLARARHSSSAVSCAPGRDGAARRSAIWNAPSRRHPTTGSPSGGCLRAHPASRVFIATRTPGEIWKTTFAASQMGRARRQPETCSPTCLAKTDRQCEAPVTRRPLSDTGVSCQTSSSATRRRRSRSRSH